MIWSKYNVMFKKENHFFLYNSLSNSFLELSKDNYAELQSFSKNISLKDDDFQKELIDLKIIVEDDDLEIKRIIYKTRTKRFLKDKLILTICPTLSCNFNCSYCFEQSHPSINMTEIVESKITKYIQNHATAKSLNVTWFGGEPLMNFKSIKRLSNIFLNLPLKYSASIITNGYLLSEEIASQLESLKINNVQITLDGLQDLHDSRRHLKKGGGTFETIINNLKRAASICKNISFSIRMNIDNSNSEHYLNLRNYILSLMLDNVHIAPAFVVDYSPEQSNSDVMTPFQQKDYLVDLSLNKGLKYERFYPSCNRYECAVRNMNTFVIGPEGELYKCWNDVGDSTRIYGTIENKLINEKVMMEYLLEADPLEDEECLNCFLFPVCGGGCPYQRLWNRHHESRKSYCPLHKHFLEELLWTHYKLKNNLILNHES